MELTRPQWVGITVRSVNIIGVKSMDDIDIQLKPEICYEPPTNTFPDRYWKKKYGTRTDLYLIGWQCDNRTVHYLGSLIMTSTKRNIPFLNEFMGNMFHEVGHFLMEDEDTTSEQEDYALDMIERYLWRGEAWGDI